MRIARYVALLVVLVLSVTAVACGSGSDSEETATATPVSESTSSPVDAPAVKLSANNSSDEELEAAFEAAGIPNAELWAHEVEEYRPYPEDDTDFTKLREGFAEHNADTDIVNAIIALLELP